MSATRKLAAILAADVVGFSRMAGAEEDRTLARLRALRSDLIDPTIAVHNGRVFKRTGDGVLVEFRSVVDAVRCAIEVQEAMIMRNAGLPLERRIEFRIGVHLGDVVEEVDGDIMGDGVNIAARLEGIAKPGAICLSEDAYRQVKSRLGLSVTDIGPTTLKNIAEPVRAYALQVSETDEAKLSSVSTQAKVIPVLKLSIALLPFINLSDDSTPDYFADGLIDSLTTDLAGHVPNLFVIGRGSAFTYKNKTIDPKQVGQELGVRYLMQGSVQRGGGRVRVNAYLIDTETGAQLWAERFDGDTADLLALQDQIAGRIANSLGMALYLDSARQPKSGHVNPDPPISRCGVGLYSSWAIELSQTSMPQSLFTERRSNSTPKIRTL